MGWLLENASSCEGYVIGLIRRDGRLEELTYPIKLDVDVLRPDEIQIECDCGWRSPRIPAPLSATWSPYCVTMRQEDENTAMDLWIDHVKALDGRDPHEALWSIRKRRDGT